MLAIDVLGLGNAGVGYLDAAFGVGAIREAGRRRSGWNPPARRRLRLGVLAWGVGVALLGATTSSRWRCMLLAGVGAGNTVVDVAAVTLLQRSAPDAVLGRVFGALESVLLAALGLGAVAAPVAIHLVGTRAALIVTGLVLPVVVLLAARLLLPLDRVDPEIRVASRCCAPSASSRRSPMPPWSSSLAAWSPCKSQRGRWSSARAIPATAST